MNVSDEIQRTGYCHIKNFLTPNEIDDLIRFYENAPPPSNNLYPTLDYGVVPDTIETTIMDKVHMLHDTCFPGEVFIDESMTFFPVVPADPSRSINLPYHQDHESFFLIGEHYHYLNAWMVIEKGDPAHSNLTIVPFDALRAKSQILHDFCVGNGATVISGDLLQNDNLGTWYKLDFDINDITAFYLPYFLGRKVLQPVPASKYKYWDKTVPLFTKGHFGIVEHGFLVMHVSPDKVTYEWNTVR